MYEIEAFQHKSLNRLFTWSSEDDRDEDGSRREWIERLNTLEDICDVSGYTPRFAVTEYAFSPATGTNWSCIGANQLTQAVYYMRRILMDVSMRSSSNYLWDYSMYYQHPQNPEDTGWFLSTDADTSRAVRKAAQLLHDDSAGKPGLSRGTSTWLKAYSKRNVTYAPHVFYGGKEINYVNLMFCTWKNARGEKWGAVWFYYNKANWPYYLDISTQSAVVFEIEDANAPSSASLYKVSFSSPYGYGNTSWVDQQTTVNRVHVSGNKYKYELTGIVDENPTFLKFSSN